MREDFDRLERDILAFVRAADGDFDELALRIFRFQHRHNAPYRAYCDARRCDPAAVADWAELPAIPAEAFKAEIPLSCHAPDACERVFLTSGTTGEVRGRHFLANTRLYEASILEGWRAADLPVGLCPLFLSRAPARLPESSLACMFEFQAGNHRGDPWLIEESGTIAIGRLRRALEAEEPVLLFSTALALRHLFESIEAPLPLPAKSWVFQTGGYKGIETVYDPHALYATIEALLGVPPQRVINEYGMTELSTPSYTTGLGEPHSAPPWLRVRTIDPETNCPNPPGRPGHLVFVDLANLNSVLAVRTADLGTALDAHHFVLQGRDSAAPLRGCSRAADAYLQRS